VVHYINKFLLALPYFLTPVSILWAKNIHKTKPASARELAMNFYWAWRTLALCVCACVRACVRVCVCVWHIINLKKHGVSLHAYQSCSDRNCQNEKKIAIWLLSVVDFNGNPAIWQHSIVEMLPCAWLLSLDSDANKLCIWLKLC